GGGAGTGDPAAGPRSAAVTGVDQALDGADGRAAGHDDVVVGQVDCAAGGDSDGIDLEHLVAAAGKLKLSAGDIEWARVEGAGVVIDPAGVPDFRGAGDEQLSSRAGVEIQRCRSSRCAVAPAHKHAAAQHHRGVAEI